MPECKTVLLTPKMTLHMQSHCNHIEPTIEDMAREISFVRWKKNKNKTIREPTWSWTWLRRGAWFWCTHLWEASSCCPGVAGEADTRVCDGQIDQETFVVRSLSSAFEKADDEKHVSNYTQSPCGKKARNDIGEQNSEVSEQCDSLENRRIAWISMYRLLKVYQKRLIDHLSFTVKFPCKWPNVGGIRLALRSLIPIKWLPVGQ